MKNEYLDFRSAATLSVDGPLPFRIDVYGHPPPGVTAVVAKSCDRTGLAPAGIIKTVEGARYAHVPYEPKRRRPVAYVEPKLPDAPVAVPVMPAREIKPAPVVRTTTGFLSAAERRRAAADRLWARQVEDKFSDDG